MKITLYVVIDRNFNPMIPTVTPSQRLAIRDAADYNAMPSREHQRPFGVARLKVVECVFNSDRPGLDRAGIERVIGQQGVPVAVGFGGSRVAETASVVAKPEASPTEKETE